MPEVTINGPEGRLEGRYQHGHGANAPIALVLHPHPQYGGTMNNKVVYGVYQVFARRGFSVLRFNFRGVGRSQGTYDSGQGELSDAASALDWLQSGNPNAASCWVGGFSFGAWICMQLLMRRPEIDGFVALSPPTNDYDFTFLSPCPSSGIIIQGAADTLVPEPEVARLAEKLAAQRGIEVAYQTIAEAGHFFEDHMAEMTDTIESYLDLSMARAANEAGPQPGR